MSKWVYRYIIWGFVSNVCTLGSQQYIHILYYRSWFPLVRSVSQIRWNYTIYIHIYIYIYILVIRLTQSNWSWSRKTELYQDSMWYAVPYLFKEQISVIWKFQFQCIQENSTYDMCVFMLGYYMYIYIYVCVCLIPHYLLCRGHIYHKISNSSALITLSLIWRIKMTS